MDSHHVHIGRPLSLELRLHKQTVMKGYDETKALNAEPRNTLFDALRDHADACTGRTWIHSIRCLTKRPMIQGIRTGKCVSLNAAEAPVASIRDLQAP